MAKEGGFKFNTTDGVIVGIGALLLTFFWYLEQKDKGHKHSRGHRHHHGSAAGANDGSAQG